MITKNKRIVVKVGTSTLTYDTGKINLRQINNLARVLSDLRNQGYEVVLVSSGAIGVAMGKLGYKTKPSDTKVKQSLAAIGQCELMALYDKMFSEYHNTVAQILLTRSDIDIEKRKQHTKDTFNTLLDMGIIPIVNENDTVSVEEIEFGDNDSLSATVAKLVKADLLVLFSDIDGLFDDNPNENPDARLIPVVKEINDEIRALCGEAGTERGTGGMITKIHAAEIATEAGIPTVIMNGEAPQDIYKLIDGHSIGTIFTV